MSNKGKVDAKGKHWLYTEYCIKRKSTHAIAASIGVRQSSVCRALSRYGIERRTLSEAKTKYDIDPEYLRKSYLEDGKSVVDLAEEFGVNRRLITWHLHANNIPIKSRSDSVRVGAMRKRRPWYESIDPNELRRLYCTRRLPYGKIAEYYGRDDVGVWRALVYYNIPLRGGPFGSDHPMWNGGSSYSPYCSAFTNALKEQIRDEYGRRCFMCSVPEVECSRKLHIHHVDYNKSQGCGHRWSLIPLCASCHAKTNFDRWYWFALLNNYWLDKYIPDWIEF